MSSPRSRLVLIAAACALFAATLTLAPSGDARGRNGRAETGLVARAAEWEDRFEAPESDFEPGTATLREDTSDVKVEKTENGFTITMPSGGPVATPAVVDGRLYVSGGFSSEEFYCCDAETGAVIWGVDLSDDGPSWAVVVDDSVIFNTESCTIFALDAKTGQHRWSWYLGDPLMSSPTVADGRVYAVYPVEGGGGGGFGGGGFGGGGFGGGAGGFGGGPPDDTVGAPGGVLIPPGPPGEATDPFGGTPGDADDPFGTPPCAEDNPFDGAEAPSTEASPQPADAPPASAGTPPTAPDTPPAAPEVSPATGTPEPAGDPAPFGGDSSTFGDGPFPDGVDPAEEAMDDADPNAAEPEEGKPTHALACFDLETGKVLWQRWVDSDCTSAPIVDGEDVYVATFTGSLFRFHAVDGTLREARDLAATSAPVFARGNLYITRRSGATVASTEDAAPKVDEFVAIHSPRSLTVRRKGFVATAPWLNAEIQRHSLQTQKAGAFESLNGIGGGFGGGFAPAGNAPAGGPGGPGGGLFSVEDPAEDDAGSDSTAAGDEPADPPAAEPGTPPSFPGPGQFPGPQAIQGGSGQVDGLIITQQQAISNLGQGNVSTLQGFQGSRLLHWGGHNFTTMGDRVVSTSARTGRAIWTAELPGDIETVGGHLGTPPVPVGEDLLVGTVDGHLLRIDRQTGRTRQKIEIGSEIRFAPIVAGGRAYVGTQDGKVVAVTLENAEADWPQWGGNPAHTGVVDRSAE